MSENQYDISSNYTESEPITPAPEEVTLEEPMLDGTDSQPPQKKNKQKKEKRRTGKESFSRTRVIIGVLLIVAAIVVALLIIPLLSGKTETYHVLQAKVDIPAGVKITDENIATYFDSFATNDHALYAAGIPADKSRDILRDCYTKRDIYKGKYATVDDFSKTNLIYSDRVPEGKVLVAINIPSLEGNVGYMPKSGDIIRIYRMVTAEGTASDDIYFDAANIHVPIGHYGNNTYAKPYEYLQYVQIHKAIDGDLLDADANNTAEVAFVLVVNDGVQAQQVVEAANSGNYYFALISSGDKGRADAFLKLQDKIIEEGAQGAGRKEVLFDMDKLTTSEDYIPARNTTVRFGVTKSIDGITSLDYPPMLKYVTLMNVYDQNGVNMNIPVEEKYDDNGRLIERVPTKVGLHVTEEQAELIQEYIDNGGVIMELVTETKSQISSGFDAVNEYLWNERAQELLANAGNIEGIDNITNNTPENAQTN